MCHPQDEEMLKYADGELSGRIAGEIRSHLEACWECRAAYEQLQNTVSECVSYRKNVLQKHLPPPPAPWTDIYQRFAEIDAAVASPSFLDRAAQVFPYVKNPDNKDAYSHLPEGIGLLFRLLCH